MRAPRQGFAQVQKCKDARVGLCFAGCIPRYLPPGARGFFCFSKLSPCTLPARTADALRAFDLQRKAYTTCLRNGTRRTVLPRAAFVLSTAHLANESHKKKNSNSGTAERVSKRTQSYDNSDAITVLESGRRLFCRTRHAGEENGTHSSDSCCIVQTVPRHYGGTQAQFVLHTWLLKPGQ